MSLAWPIADTRDSKSMLREPCKRTIDARAAGPVVTWQPDHKRKSSNPAPTGKIQVKLLILLSIRKVSMLNE